MVSAQEISDELYASIRNSVIKHGSTVDASVIIKAFDILTNKIIIACIKILLVKVSSAIQCTKFPVMDLVIK